MIRRDNIGDLVCTTPMIRLLRMRYPEAWIGVLANSYNVAILEGNPDINEVFSYQKAKHRDPAQSAWSVWLSTARLIWQLRRRRVDVAIAASPGAERYARLIGARKIVSEKSLVPMHEVERCAGMLDVLASGKAPGPLLVKASASVSESISLKLELGRSAGCRLAVHISARRPKQRWPVESFAAAIKAALTTGLATQVLIFWSPGADNDPVHPGDDLKLSLLMEKLHDDSVTPVPTSELGELIAGLSLADMVLCSDGGAMHVAAGLGKPVVCLFGDSDPARWHPWGVPHEVLQPASRDVKDITVDEVISACRRLAMVAGVSSEHLSQ